MDKKKKDVDFKNYPGVLTPEVYSFPTLYYKDSADKIRFWKIEVRCIQPYEGSKRYGQGWDLNEDTFVPLRESHLKDPDVKTLPDDAKFPPGTWAQHWTTTGRDDGKQVRHEPSIVKKGCYEGTGRKDEQTVFTQALIQARSKYNKKLDTGASTDKNNLEVAVKRLIPMALHNMHLDDNIRHVVYPAYIQRKYDGIRFLAYQLDDGSVVMYSRRNKDFTGMNHIRAQLKTLFDKMKDDDIEGMNPRMYIDGEFYHHGTSLQDISGDARNENAEARLEGFIFDIIYGDLKQPFKNRVDMLAIVGDYIELFELDKLIVIDTELVNNKEEMYAKYQGFVDEKYEGAIVRMAESVYPVSYTREKRVYDVLKMKPKYDAEYELIGFAQGKKGKDVGALIWVMKTEDGKQFTSVPKDTTYEERYAMYSKLKNTAGMFDAEYKGKMMTVQFEDKSKDGVPLRAKALGIRNPAD